MFLQSARSKFAAQKMMAERAFGQNDDTQIRQALSPETNSVAVIMKHMAGNMLSRWTDLLTSDGEKPWRHRDQEFVDDFADRAELIADWEKGWTCLFDTLDSLTDADLLRAVTIRGEPHTVIDAIVRQLDHYGYHVGQIVLISRILAGDKWEVLTIPRGGSEEFNRRKAQERQHRADP